MNTSISSAAWVVIGNEEGTTRMRLERVLVMLLAFAFLASGPVFAQEPAPTRAATSAEDLAQLLQQL
jgi:hypothetical protein